jgi:hypothetical protein
MFIHKVFNYKHTLFFLNLLNEFFQLVLDFISHPARSSAPITPRVILIGPYGCGKRTQAQALAKKYDLVNVSISSLIKEAVANDDNIGMAIKSHLTKGTTGINHF